MDFEISDLDEATGAHVGLSDDPVEILLGRMRYPSLSLHGIEGAFSGKGSKTVIPSKVIGKFSLRFAIYPLLEISRHTNKECFTTVLYPTKLQS